MNCFQIEAAGTCEDSFSEDDWKKLNSVALVCKADATFIREAIEVMYHDNLFILRQRSLTGQQRKHQSDENSEEFIQKQEVTPVKGRTITKLFSRRLDQAQIGAGEKLKRFGQMNKHITNAINYIVSFKLPRLKHS